jgi:hypothetical protein
MRQFQIPKKLISIVQMTQILSGKCKSNLTEEFMINRGLRQGDALSNTALQFDIRKKR